MKKDIEIKIINVNSGSDFQEKINELLKEGNWRICNIEISVTDHMYNATLIKSQEGTKAVLEFNLPEDQYEFDQANKAGDMSIVLSDLSNYLRSKIKYPNENDHEEYIKAMEEVRQKFYDLAGELNVEI